MLFPYAFTLSTLGHIEVHEKYLKVYKKYLVSTQIVRRY